MSILRSNDESMCANEDSTAVGASTVDGSAHPSPVHGAPIVMRESAERTKVLTSRMHSLCD